MIHRIKKPKGISNSPIHIIPHLPEKDCFFDSRHWTWGGCDEELPFSVTTRISANNQQFLKDMQDNKHTLPAELQGKKFRIRKLTPTECLRLMGCDEPTIHIMANCGLSNSALYKLAGNSIVVDVLFHLFRKMFIETEQEFDGTPIQQTLF